MRTPKTLIGAIVATSLLLAACGSSDRDDGAIGSATTVTAPADGTPSGDPDGGGFPVTVDSAEGELTIEARPERIVVLSPSLTETVYAVGAGDQVIAVDDQSNFPEGVPSTSLSGYEPNLEAIADHEPDLVIASDAPGDLVDGLAKVEIPVLLLPAAVDLDEAFTQISTVGTATGHPDEARDLLESMHDRVDTARERVPEGDAVSYFHELDETLYTVTSSTFLGQLYAMANFENIADDADPDGFGYPQLSAESLIEADPDAIFLADTRCCGQDADTVSKRAGWSEMTAVKNGSIFALDDDIASRWGPRIVDLFEEIVDARIELAND